MAAICSAMRTSLAYTDDLGVVSARVADHLNRFWDPRMRQALVEHCSQEASSPSPALRMALPLLRDVGA